LAALLATFEEFFARLGKAARGSVGQRLKLPLMPGGRFGAAPFNCSLLRLLGGGSVFVDVISQTEVSQPNTFGQGTTQVVQQTTLQAQDKPANRIELREGATVDDLVQSLQQIGATARDIISILQAMKAAGALEADLEVM